jgi:hypothetical protein
VTNRFGKGKLVEIVQRAVRRLVQSLSVGNLRLIVAHLVQEVGLTDTQVSRLLCTPADLLEGVLWSARMAPVQVLERDQAMSLVRGSDGRGLAA